MDALRHALRSLWSLLIGLAVLGALGYGAYWGLSRLIVQLASLTSDVSKAIVAAGATVVVATVSLVFGKIWEQRLKLQDEVRQRKLPVYQAHLQFMFKTLFASKDGKTETPQQEVVDAFRDFTGQILVWGGAEVIKTWTTFKLHDWQGKEPLAGFYKFEAFIKAIRKELGNKNENLAEGDLLKLFVNDFDTYKLAALTPPSAESSPSDRPR
jgi:hypothetical protein